MTGYHALIMGHLLCFGYWLGADLGVFYSSQSVSNPKLSAEARGTAAKIMMFLDLIPRICLVLILPFGVSLASALGLFPFSTGTIAAIWATSLAWMVIVTVVYYAEGRSWAHALGRVDWVIRFSVIFGLLWLAYAAYTGSSGIAAAPWLALKCLLFATVIFSGVCIRWAVKGLHVPFAAIMQGTATPEDDAFVKRAIGRARPFVLYIWLGVFVIGWIGVAKPSL